MRQLVSKLKKWWLVRRDGKFAGETEKNLDATFDDAERASATLAVDEADDLFGKKS